MIIHFIEYQSDWNISSECMLDLLGIQRLIRERSHRELVISSTFFQVHYALYSLAYHPDMGFFIQAREAIPVGTPLFSYGGIFVKEIDVDAFKGRETYLIKVQDSNSREIYIDAIEQGDLGSLLMNLPGDESQLYLGIKPIDCLVSNCSRNYRDGICYFIATRNIQPREPIGYDYGLTYWMNAFKVPLFLASDKHKFQDPNQIGTSKLIVCYDSATGNHPCFDNEHNSYFSFTFSKLTIDFFMVFLQECSNIETRSWQNVKEELLPIQLEVNAAKINRRNLVKLYADYTSSRLKAMTFFGIHTERSGCMPPEGYEFVGNRTILSST